MAKVMTAADPAMAQTQKASEGRSPANTTLIMAVASGNAPSTTPPCEAGTVCMAMAERVGKPNTTPAATTSSVFTSLDDGHGWRVNSSKGPATAAAATVRPNDRNSGFISSTARRVKGSVRAKMATPMTPRR